MSWPYSSEDTPMKKSGMDLRRKALRVLLALACLALGMAASAADGPSPRGFDRRGFYLHGSWVTNHPFSVRSWQRADYESMFRLLRDLGFNTVMMWPTPECAPMPLSEEDTRSLRKYRAVIEDAHSAGLKCWIGFCPNVIAKQEIRSTPWEKRSLYAYMTTVRLDDPVAGPAYLRHRSAVLRQFDNADAFVVIDGDPGGYPGAPVEEYMRILKADRETVPQKPVIPWLWSGWGRDYIKGGFWTQPVDPYVAATLQALKSQPGKPWEIMPGRSHRDGWANGRKNIELAEKAGMMGQSTIMCYEAIEFEPTPPAAVLQFDLIRANLREEGRFAATARGVFGNAQQPVMVLPNLYYFARGSADLSYLDKPEPEVLSDLAREMGGDPAVLVPAWSCLKRSLDDLPSDLARGVRSLKLNGRLARNIPGGPVRYVEILAAQVESRRELLEAVAVKPRDAAEAAGSLAKGAAALIKWWHVHRYVGPGLSTDPFKWDFIHPSQTSLLRRHAKLCAAFGPSVVTMAAQQLSERNLLSKDKASQRLTDLTN
jgi:hypothetical protein